MRFFPKLGQGILRLGGVLHAGFAGCSVKCLGLLCALTLVLRAGNPPTDRGLHIETNQPMAVTGSLALESPGEFLATASDDKPIRIWGKAATELISAFRPQVGEIVSMPPLQIASLPLDVDITVGTLPRTITFDGTCMWIANRASNSVTRVSASTCKVTGTFPVGREPLGTAFDGQHIWISNFGSGTVTKLLPSTGAEVGTYPVGIGPGDLVFDGTYLWVSNSGSNTVTRLLASTGAAAGTFPVGNEPHGIAFDGTHIWVANWNANTVMKLRASTGEVVATCPVGEYPNGVTFDGRCISLTSANLMFNSWIIRIASGRLKLRRE